MLVVLDNFEHVLAARDAVTGLLEACPAWSCWSRAGSRCGSGPGASTRSRRWRCRDPRTPCRDSPSVQLFLDRAALPGRSRPGRGDGPGRRRDLPPAGRDSAGHRAGRGPASAAAAASPAGPADPPAAGAGRRPARPACPAEDHARRDRLELRAAGRAGSRSCSGSCACSPAAARWTRWKRCALNSSPALDGLTSLAASNLLRMPTAPAASGGPRVAVLETIREYGGEQLQAHAEAGRPGGGMPPGTWRWPRKPPSRWRARTRHRGWRGSMTSTTTCDPRSAGRRSRATG